MPEGMHGGLAEVNIGYAIAMPYQIYGSLELFIDGRNNSAELDTGVPETSHALDKALILA